MKKPSTLVQLKAKLSDLLYVDLDPRVVEARQLVRKERAPQVAELERQIIEVRSAKPKPRPRFPANVPPAVLARCQDFWKGTEEYKVFRIHLWNDKGVWTSWPAGGYSDNGGFHYVSPCFFLISMTENDNARGRAKQLRRIDSTKAKPVTKQFMQAVLDKL